MNSITLDTAKVFKTGRSQAVRLPKEYRFDTDEVTIERVGDAVVLRPKVTDNAAWVARLAEICSKFEGVGFIERERKPLTDEGFASFD
jgi:antitoxin VapB